MYSPNPSAALVLKGAGWSILHCDQLKPGNRPGSIYAGSWLGLGAGLDRHGNFHLDQNSTLGLSSQ